MSKLKLVLLSMAVAGLFACTSSEQQKTTKPQKTAAVGYLKADISQAELNNPAEYKRYSYYCKDFTTGETAYLATYFPLSRESRKQENFGIYFQLNGAKAEPFDHLANKAINAAGTRFEVSYRSYYPIQGSYVDLIARERSSIYYKNQNGTKLPWLECRQG
ncbi:hypothetical protein B0187_02600 [Haemophilus paracuniculus]|uniref:Lipoprotein n=1 Tax=Haemophilus paracuniculus TaxID=734 RepID=A0A1T0ATC5_9PAST|nr:hypothetical protein [Haemophilus paracuniculus]OOR99718.1 hypothetical protein B0187_02600 [Haemophilus paracuniculus]